MNTCPYPQAEICDTITVETLSDAMITIFKQVPDFFNPETGTREMVNISNFDVFIKLELNKFRDYLVNQQTLTIHNLVNPDFINQVIVASMKKVPSDWIPIN